MEDLKTKMMKNTPYELLKDDEKKQLSKNNRAKMTLYNALPRKEYERVFMCKIGKKDEETIDSGFIRFNAIVTSLIYLDQDYPSKNYVMKAIDLDVEINLVTGKIDLEEFAEMVLGIKVVEAQDNRANAIITRKKITSLVSFQSPRKTRLLSGELGVIAKTGMNLKMIQLVLWRSTLLDVLVFSLKIILDTSWRE
nr:hypothetical protein [Tanacetum cinerariifolium]